MPPDRFNSGLPDVSQENLVQHVLTCFYTAAPIANPQLKWFNTTCNCAKLAKHKKCQTLVFLHSKIYIWMLEYVPGEDIRMIDSEYFILNSLCDSLLGLFFGENVV